MSLFAYICVRTTADFTVPAAGYPQAEFQRKVHNFAQGLIGGVLQVGEIRWFTVERAIPNHLLCDGRTISRLNYRELVTHLAGEDAVEATLPDLSGALTVSTPTVVQTVTPGGTIQTDQTSPTDQGGTGGTQGGNVPSGSRIYDPNFPYPIWYIPPEIGA